MQIAYTINTAIRGLALILEVNGESPIYKSQTPAQHNSFFFLLSSYQVG
jgi:hypothetical protein